MTEHSSPADEGAASSVAGHRNADPLVTLPGTDVRFRPLGLGTWAWGDRYTWGMGGYDTSLTEATIAGAFSASLDGGITLLDTAEVYGKGESERIIGRLLRTGDVDRSAVVLATKWFPSPRQINVKSAMRSALEASLERLGVDQVDLYQVHGPTSLRGHNVIAEGLASLVADGLTKSVGVSNYSVREMMSMQAQLARRGTALASNQIEFSLLRDLPLTSGMLQRCRELGIVVLAYSPIGQGRLSGKYSAQNPPPGKRGFAPHPMETVDRVVAELRSIGNRHGRTPSQVALRWLIQHGTVPIPGAKNAEQAMQNAGALGWQLTSEEMEQLDRASLPPRWTISNRVWQHG